MKVLINISEQKYKWICENPLVYDSDLEISVRKGIAIPENATNGDMLKIIFKPYLVTETAYGYHVFLTENDYKTGEWLNYSKIWWNAPYKAESEDNK